MAEVAAGLADDATEVRTSSCATFCVVCAGEHLCSCASLHEAIGTQD
jgi:hypothetical protein